MNQRILKELSRNPIVYIYGSVFLAAITWQIHEIMLGWDHVILAHHGFRQTQTAISAYYFARDGLSFYTTIPVLGPDWIIPLEFPVYQWIVAVLHKLSGLGLEQAGRTTSVCFHAVNLLLISLILRKFNVSKTGILGCLTLVTLSPLATYWAQGVLIESISVSAMLLYVLLVMITVRRNNTLLLLLAVACGGLAALIKVTTFAVGWGFLILYFIFCYLTEGRDTRGIPRILLVKYSLLLMVPVGIGCIWIFHTGTIIKNHELVSALSNSTSWFFGSLGDRFSISQWSQMLRNTVLWAFGTPIPLMLAVIPFSISGIRRMKVLLFALVALSGPLVFWGVYHVHDYYTYEVIFFSASAIGICFDEAIQRLSKWGKAGLVGTQLLLFVSVAASYEETPYAWLLRNDHLKENEVFLKSIANDIPEKSFIVVAGNDWDPTVAYCTQRKTVMMRWHSWLHLPQFKSAIASTLSEGNSFAGLIIRADTLTPQQQAEVLDAFGFEGGPDHALKNTILFYGAADPKLSTYLGKNDAGLIQR